jgi:hypothetical protein
MQHYLDHTDFKLEADHSSREGSPERGRSDRDSDDEDIAGMADSFHQLDVDHTHPQFHHHYSNSRNRIMPLGQDPRDVRRASVRSSSSNTAVQPSSLPQPSNDVRRRSSQHSIVSSSGGRGGGDAGGPMLKKHSIASSGASISSISSNKY